MMTFAVVSMIRNLAFQSNGIFSVLRVPVQVLNSKMLLMSLIIYFSSYLYFLTGNCIHTSEVCYKRYEPKTSYSSQK